MTDRISAGSPMGSLLTSLYATPMGPLAIAARGDVLVTIYLEGNVDRLTAAMRRLAPADPGALAPSIRAAFDAYFAADLGALDVLEVDPAGTPFQLDVWRALRAVRPGTTISYKELARRIGRPDSVRAVGAANGANPVPIVVPCHRVIGADGSLVGYGGGLDRKRWLLAHEGVVPGRLW